MKSKEMKSISTFLFVSIFLFSCNRMHVFTDDVKNEETVSYVFSKRAKSVRSKNTFVQSIGQYFYTALDFEKNALSDEDPTLYLRFSYDVDNEFFIVVDEKSFKFQLREDGDMANHVSLPEPRTFGSEIALGVLVGAVGVYVEPDCDDVGYTDPYLEYSYSIDKELREHILAGKEISFRFYLNRNPYEFSVKGRKLRQIKKFLRY